MTEDSTNSNNKYFCIDCEKYTKPLRKNRCNSCYKRFKQHKLPKKKCECSPECQEMIYIKTISGKPNNFAIGHHMKMENHYNWKGGRWIGEYIFLRIKGKWIREHRKIFEDHYQCCILPWGYIHHINEDKLDNSIENLKLVSIKTHPSEHKKDMSNRFCNICKSKNKGNQWHNDLEGHLCSYCYEMIRKLLSNIAS